MNGELLTADFFRRPTKSCARELIGKVLFRRIGNQTIACRIVEAEAYLPKNDDACHASKKKTPRNEVMFGQPGSIYVYAIHAKYCVNFVTESAGVGCAALIRAAEPIAGIELMKQKRGVEALHQLLNGPSKLCQATSIDKALNGLMVSEDSGLWLVDDGDRPGPGEIKITPRIGVTSAKEKRLRFVRKGSLFASGPKYLR